MHRIQWFFILTFAFMIVPSAFIKAGQDEHSLLSQLHVQLQQQQEEIRRLRGEIDEMKHHSKEQSRSMEKSTTTHNSAHYSAQPFSTSTTPMQMTLPGKQQATDSQSAYAEAIDLLNQRRFAEAEVVLNKFITNYPNDPFLVNASYWLAEIYYIRGEYQQAALKFGEAYEIYIRNKNGPYAAEAISKAPEIMIKLALSLSNIGKYQDAKVILAELDKEFKSIPNNLKQQVELLRREIGRNTVNS